MTKSQIKCAVTAMMGLSLTSFSLPAHAADAAAGKTVFNNTCAICHSAQAGKNLIGPSLFDITGRKTASVAGYQYSAANKKADLTWDDATLNTYLQNPQKVIPGTKMTYGGLKDDTKRADLIAYLTTLK
jgi:cytochrome c2